MQEITAVRWTSFLELNTTQLNQTIWKYVSQAFSIKADVHSMHFAGLRIPKTESRPIKSTWSKCCLIRDRNSTTTFYKGFVAILRHLKSNFCPVWSETFWISTSKQMRREYLHKWPIVTSRSTWSGLLITTISELNKS